MWEADVGQQPPESTSGSRRTRSHLQEAAVWTIQDMLILVNEIAVVEGDWQNSLSTHQKWTIIAETCNALGVARNANQCRRKWQSLLADYNLVKECKLNSGSESYWSLGSERRKEAGLPSEFDKDLYKAMEDFMKAPDRADTDPECDPEAGEVDVLNVEESGPEPKRRRRRSIPQNRLSEERKQPKLEVEHVNPEPQNRLSEVRKQPKLEAEHVNPEPLVVEDMGQILAAKLMENTELIHAILAGNVTENVDDDDDLADVRNEESLKIEKVRRKADKLVACFEDLAKNLEHLCGVVDKGKGHVRIR
ncbi:trihelix transcription factor ASR3 isoform X2 [Spinacia oleracea]|uniref:Trihelix transcription factor ASR3 isoform X2 n=1 Tax=Spinacia oleracea TaxID=3562 RepID=A0A9R0I7M4_SPIOL|nr:trihelix transcription factor ASR3 isoform X2 [Spinacia oleracea]XP_056697707.1 trihelix transcription factor ASR3 isoform X2 [Spinacia oleracea]